MVLPVTPAAPIPLSVCYAEHRIDAPAAHYVEVAAGADVRPAIRNRLNQYPSTATNQPKDVDGQWLLADSGCSRNISEFCRVGSEEVLQSLRMASCDGANCVGNAANLLIAPSFS